MNTIAIIVLIILVVLLFPLLKLLKTPIKWAFKLLINAGVGFLCLWVLNLFGSIIGLHIDITWVSAIITGVLGLPGVILLIIVKYLF